MTNWQKVMSKDEMNSLNAVFTLIDRVENGFGMNWGLHRDVTNLENMQMLLALGILSRSIYFLEKENERLTQLTSKRDTRLKNKIQAELAPMQLEMRQLSNKFNSITERVSALNYTSNKAKRDSVDAWNKAVETSKLAKDTFTQLSAEQSRLEQKQASLQRKQNKFEKLLGSKQFKLTEERTKNFLNQISQLRAELEALTDAQGMPKPNWNKDQPMLEEPESKPEEKEEVEVDGSIA